MKRQHAEQKPPIPLEHIPRRIRRRMARAQMEKRGLRHINKRDARAGKSYFARHWKEWVGRPPKGRKAG